MREFTWVRVNYNPMERFLLQTSAPRGALRITACSISGNLAGNKAGNKDIQKAEAVVKWLMDPEVPFRAVENLCEP
jgi:hypothetical protein